MTNKDFFKKLSNLLLTSEDATKDWVKSSSMRTAWNRTLICLFIGAGIGCIVCTTPLSNIISKINNGAFCFRIVMAIWLAVLIVFEFMLTATYFKYTLEGGRPIKLCNVATFYITITSLFGFLYSGIFLAYPAFFTVDSTFIVWPDHIDIALAWPIKLHFILFSFLGSVGVSHPHITSNGITVSILLFVEKLYLFCLVALLVAGYVNQHAKIRHED